MAEERELASRTIQLESKRFYVDIKENQLGKFVKIAEVAPDGSKVRVVMGLDVAVEFRNRLAEFIAFQQSIPNSAPSMAVPAPGGANLKSMMINRDGRRRYYLDLKQNRRGRFLSVSQVSTATQARDRIAVPAPDGLTLLHSALDQLLGQFAPEQHPIQLPPSRTLRVDRKTLHFDVGSNERGLFLTITEVRGQLRSSIVLPHHSWQNLAQTINNYIEQCAPLLNAGSGGQLEAQQIDSVEAGLAASSGSASTVSNTGVSAPQAALPGASAPLSPLSQDGSHQLPPAQTRTNPQSEVSPPVSKPSPVPTGASSSPTHVRNATGVGATSSPGGSESVSGAGSMASASSTPTHTMASSSTTASGSHPQSRNQNGAGANSTNSKSSTAPLSDTPPSTSPSHSASPLPSSAHTTRN